MGSIQGSINQSIGAIATASALGKHIANQEKENKAKAAEANFEAEKYGSEYDADINEAQQAILAHAKDEGLTQDEIERLQRDPEYAQTLRENVLKPQREQSLAMTSKKYYDTPEGQIEYDKNTHEFYDPKERAGEELNYAYDRLREINQRIETNRVLKFNRDSALRRVEIYGGKK